MKKIIALCLTAVMLFALAIGAFAANVSSPEKPGTDHKITIVPGKGGSAEKVVNPDGTVTIIANAESGHTFTKWEIEGEYDLISGTLNGTTVVIRPKGDIKVVATFDEKTPAKPWDGDKSPQTGNAVLPVALVAIVSLFGCAYAVKRSYNA